MKNIKRAISILLAVIFVLSAFPVSISALAAGSGTEENPYQITTASQLQDINNNLSAHYKLMNNIDLVGMDFIPIGNANSGTFTGSFDGNGFVISNLNVFAGKYAGLFGCNEGKIKNVKLSDIYVYGTRYVGGVVGENAACGEIANCQVISGKIESDGGLNEVRAGGICGSNSGNMNSNFSNGAEIAVKNGSSSSLAGGIIGRSGVSVFLQNTNNTGNVTSSSYYNSHSGGLVGYGGGTVTISDSYNTGNVTSSSYHDSHSGGLVGYGGGTVTISDSYNTGNVTSPSRCSHSGGLVGHGGGTVSISDSYNTGNVTSSSANSYSYFYSGGLVGYGGGTVTISDSYNTGNVTFSSSSYSSSYSGGLVGYGGGTVTITGSYSLNSSRHCEVNDGTVYLSEAAFRQSTSFENWDFDTTWAIDSNGNGGFPYLKTCHSPLSFNIANKTLFSGESFQLQAYKNGVATAAVTWSVTAGSASVSVTGKVVATTGVSTITATDSQGNKANCNIYAMAQNPTISVADFSVQTGKIDYSEIPFGNRASGDFLVKVYSSDNSVISISDFGDARFKYETKAAGTATLHFETVQGRRCSCTVTVTNVATDVSVSDYKSTMVRGSSYLFKATPSPNPTSSKLSWSSSDESIATVDNSGKVTAVGIGSCRITVRTDNGYSAYKDITVDAPITSMEFEQPSLTIYKGDTQKLNLIYSPIDTTSTISYSVSSYSTYGGLSVDSSGIITAKTAGTYKVRASSNGVEAYCNITVKDIPVIVDDITLDQSEANIRVGEVFKLSAAVAPENATDKTVTWASTDESVAAVSSGGMVEAIGAGKAVVTATSSNGIVAACEVTVIGTVSINHAKLYIPDVISTTEGFVEVPVMIENNPGISFASYTVRYNPESVEPIEVTNGDLFDCVLGSIESSENRVKLYFTSAETVQEDGVLARIRFRILDAQKAADIKLAYYPGNIREGEQNAVALNIAEGFVDLKYYPPFSLTYTCPEVAGRQATLIVSNGKTQYISESDNGVFFLDSSILGGTYDFYVKPRYGIATLVEKKFNFGSATLQSVEMEGHTTPILGDVNEDDVIDIADISMLLSTANYGKANTEIDLTGDGIISIDDISVALKATNYGMRSAIIVE